MHLVLKKYGNKIRSIWADIYWRPSTSLFMQCYEMCKIEFHAVGLKGVQAHPQKFWF